MKECLMKAIQPIMLIRPNTAPPRMERYHSELQRILRTIFKEPAKLFNNLFGDKFTTYQFDSIHKIFEDNFIRTVCQNIQYNNIQIKKNVYGLFRFCSILNHSCEPNCYVSYKNGELYLFLKYLIDENDELVINYLEGQNLPC